DAAVNLGSLVEQALARYGAQPDTAALSLSEEARAALESFFVERLRSLFERRGYAADEINAVLPEGTPLSVVAPLGRRRRLEALRDVRASDDFTALAVLFKGATNIVKDVPRAAASSYDGAALRAGLVEPAEQALADALAERQAAIA